MELYTTIENNNAFCTAVKMHGDLALMCPACHDITYIHNFYYENIIKSSQCCDKITIPDQLPIQINCDKCDYNGFAIAIDPNIADTISILNKKGYITKECCEGHGENLFYSCTNVDSKPYVLFHYGISINDVPKFWKLKITKDGFCKLVVKKNKRHYKNEYLERLDDWARNLPNRY